MKKEFLIKISNVRESVDKHKQNLLNQDLSNYYLDGRLKIARIHQTTSSLWQATSMQRYVLVQE